MRLSVVIPAHNEEGNVAPLLDRLRAATEPCADEQEFIFVDDGSSDGTLATLEREAAADSRIRVLSLSRNFGHEGASTAGLDHATGDVVVLIDADLQDPPELIGEMVERWRAGADVVYATRRTRRDEPRLKRLTSNLFYRLLDRVSEVRIPRDTGDFRLMDRRVVEAIGRLGENPRLVRGLSAWVGYRQESVLYDRDGRESGRTKYDFRKLTRLALDSICAFSLTPLRLIIWLGLLVTALGVLTLAGTLIAPLLVAGGPPSGVALLVSAVLFIGGVQLVVLGMLGHYLGLIFRNVQRRPIYLVDRAVNIKPAARHDAPLPEPKPRPSPVYAGAGPTRAPEADSHA